MGLFRRVSMKLEASSPMSWKAWVSSASSSCVAASGESVSDSSVLLGGWYLGGADMFDEVLIYFSETVFKKSLVMAVGSGFPVNWTDEVVGLWEAMRWSFLYPARDGQGDDHILHDV